MTAKEMNSLSLNLCPMSTILDDIREGIEYLTKKPFYYNDWIITRVNANTLIVIHTKEDFDKYGKSSIPAATYTLISKDGNLQAQVPVHVYEYDEKVPIFENSKLIDFSETVS